MILQTQRLRQRELRQTDWEDLCEILCDQEVMTAYEGAFGEQEVQAWLDKQFARYRADGMGLYAVVLKQTGEMIGQCGLTWQPVGDQTVLEVGYLFKKAHWHKGYATEAARGWMDYAFETLGAQEVFSIIRDTNEASQRVALRNGMMKRGRFTKYYRGVEMPHFVYSLKRPT